MSGEAPSTAAGHDRFSTAGTTARAASAFPRLASLDAFRGFVMFWIVGGKSLLMALQPLGSNPLVAAVCAQLDHAEWEGLRFYDLIWPCFMLMVGVSIPFSFRKRRLTQTRGRILLHVLNRAVILFLLGSLRASVSTGSPTFIELSSALQPIAVAYLVASLLEAKSPKMQGAVGASILVGYALLLAYVPAPGIGAGTYEKHANLVSAVDLMVLGQTHEEGWGTVISTIPTISTTILGLLIGQLLMSGLSSRVKLAVLGLAGLGGVTVGFAMSPFVPVVMKLWTASYGILSAGWACLLFLAFYWIIDVRGFRRWSFPLVVIGMNAIAAYLGPTLVPLQRIAGIFTNGPARDLGALGPLFKAAAFLLVVWLILYWMYRRRIFLRV